MSEVLICRCQEITDKEIREAIEDGARSIDGVKRRTGACMGLCQGRTCRKLITSIIAQQTNLNPGDVLQATTRLPVRPIRIDSLL